MYQKNKPLLVNVSRFMNSNKPITAKQLQSIQKQMVSNMIIMGKNAESVYDFVKETNKIRRHLNNNTLSKAGRSRILNLLNAGDVERVDGKQVLKISKPRITKWSKSTGGKFDSNILKKLEKRGLISKSVKNLINQRKGNNTTVKLDDKLRRILEILDSFSNPEKYFNDIQRICFDHLGLWFETYEEYVSWRQSIR